MVEKCLWMAIALAISASAMAQTEAMELISDRCQERECQLLWTYQGRYAATAEQLLELYRRGERYGRGAITLEEDIVSHTLLMRIERPPRAEPVELSEREQPAPSGTGRR
ncbi:hypothetical protein FCL40_11220 [Ferrimonas sediminicola]|uniref:Uncharacterized protein n=1 Tax=Ferrimonas sediminicola TaxID=2569538 RepID=A0A4U1BFC5_9GAMM|nr:hypothetical protein [Ferrimonas sediminicola]TKB48715.1 hypothetical protein FCL40_11220 [Ferrimonas sediminicola]